MLRRNSVVKSRFITATRDSRKDIAIAEAAVSVLCELLEARTLLATYTYQAPSGTTAVYLEGDSFNPGRIKVRLNSETAPFVSPDPFTNQNGMSIIKAPNGSSGFLFVDKVAAELGLKMGTALNFWETKKGGCSFVTTLGAGPARSTADDCARVL
jgi:hypothetical protein